jgi:hypothetical protein
MLTGEPVADASEAMKERATFVMCGLDENQQVSTWFACMKDFEVTALYPLNPSVVLSLPGSGDPATAVHVKHPRRAFTWAQDLTSN